MSKADATDELADAVAQGWLAGLTAALDTEDQSGLERLLGEQVMWRDVLTFAWDLTTWTGRVTAANYVIESATAARLSNVRLDEEVPPRLDTTGPEPFVIAFFRYDAPATLGRGHIRLAQEGDGVWRARTVLTQLDELREHPERTGNNRPWGVADGPVAGRVPWHEQRAQDATYSDREPAVVIVGAGQAGLSLAARLQQLDVDALLIEKNQRVGDNWRLRYPTLNLHDPMWVNNLPYIEYPTTWPVFTPRDKFADWLESYVSSLDLNVWTGSAALESNYDTELSRWNVPVQLIDGTIRVLHPRHLVLAVGLHGEALQPVYPGQDDFEGEIMHSSTFDGIGDRTGTKALVVGAGTSSHDVVQALWELGADVTLVRRSPSIVVTRKAFMVAFASHGSGTDLPPMHSDLTFASVPWPMAVQGQKRQVVQWKKDDQPVIDQLTAAGYAHYYGPDEAGTLILWLTGGRGGFYIDVGALDLIADRRVAVRQGVEITKLHGRTATLSDGSEIEADLIVNATGYNDLRENARRFIGDLVDQIPSIHHLDENGELTAIWRPTGVPGFWFMVGNIRMSRYFSKVLALQIAAHEHGLLK